MINEAFISVTKDYTPLTDDVHVTQEEDDPIQVSLTSVQQKLRKIKYIQSKWARQTSKLGIKNIC